MKVVFLTPRHIDALTRTGALKGLEKHVTEEQVRVMCGFPYSFAIESGEDVVAAFGLVEYWAGRCEAWAMIDPKCNNRFLAVHKIINRLLKVVQVRRIEAVVHCDFPQGHRWVKALGFTLEVDRMRAYTINGEDASLYVLIKG